MNKIEINRISRLRAMISVTEIARSYDMTLRRQGGIYITPHCLFHTDETLCMYLHELSGEFLCFGCGAKGDVVHLIQQLESVDSKEAVAILERTDGCLKPTMTHLT